MIAAEPAEQIRRDLEQLINVAPRRAEQLLAHQDGFAPYALALTTQRVVLGAMPPATDPEQPGLDSLERWLKAHWGDAPATAIVFDSWVDSALDAISLALRHRAGAELLVAIPYRLQARRVNFLEPIFLPGSAAQAARR